MNRADPKRKAEFLARAASLRDLLEKEGLGVLLLRVDEDGFRFLVRTQRIEAVEEFMPRLWMRWSDCFGVDLEPIPGGGVVLSVGFGDS